MRVLVRSGFAIDDARDLTDDHHGERKVEKTKRRTKEEDIDKGEFGQPTRKLDHQGVAK